MKTLGPKGIAWEAYYVSASIFNEVTKATATFDVNRQI